MAKYGYLLRIIDYDINKCKATAKAEQIGATAVWETLTGDSTNVTDFKSKVTYRDGTTAYFNGNDELAHITIPNGKEIDLIGSDEEYSTRRADYVKERFKDQEKRIKEQLSEDDYDFFTTYRDVLDSNAFELILNVADRDNWGEKDLKDSIDILVGGKENYELLVGGRERYAKLLGTLDLNGYGDFYTVDIKQERREMGEANWTTVEKNRRIYKNDWNNSASLIDTGQYYSDGKAPHPFADEDNVHWTEVTIYEDGNKSNNGLVVWTNTDGFVKTGKGQKFERRIIDEANHLIFQYPYNPRHKRT